MPCQQGRVSADLLLGFNAAVEDDLENRQSHHDHEEEHEHDEDINSVQILVDTAFEPNELIDRLQTSVQKEIYRIKGFVSVPNKAMRLVLQGVRQQFDYFFDRPWQATEKRQTKLVFIGHALKQDEVAAAILANR